jgi:ABC-type amino acid transport substrate-binding protein
MKPSLVASGLVFVATLLNACTSVPGAAPQATLARVGETKSLTLGFREDSKPFSFRDESGNPVGYSVDLCKRVASSLQSQLKLPKLDLKWVPVTVATRVQAVRDGAIDLECGSTSRTFDREQIVDFSNTIWVQDSSFVSLASAPLQRITDLNGKRVGVIAGSTTEVALKALAARGVAPALVSVPTHSDGVAAVRDGRAQAYATDRLILVGEVLGGPAGAMLLLSDDSLSIETYSLMMRRDADFRLAINRALAELYLNGDLAAVFQKTFGPNVRPSRLLEAAFLLNALPER